MFSSSSASFSKNFVVLHSAAEAAAFFPNAKKILPVTEIYPANTPAQLTTSLIKNKKMDVGKLAFPIQSLGAYDWYSPHLAAPPECVTLNTSCSVDACPPGCFTSNVSYVLDEQGGQTAPAWDVQFTVSPAAPCPGDVVTILINPMSPLDAPGTGDPAPQLSFATNIGTVSITNLTPWDPAIDAVLLGSKDYFGPGGTILQWNYIVDPSNRYITSIEFNLLLPETACTGNGFIEISMPHSQAETWILRLECCPSSGSVILIPEWRSFVSDCPPESCMSIGGNGWLSPFTDSAPSCESGSLSLPYGPM